MRTILLLLISALAIGCNAPIAEEVPVFEQIDSDSEEMVMDATPTEQTSPPLATDTPMPTTTSLADTLPIIQPAPEIANDVWLNSEPIKLSDLRGKVVLVEFWTFG